MPIQRSQSMGGFGGGSGARGSGGRGGDGGRGGATTIGGVGDLGGEASGGAGAGGGASATCGTGAAAGGAVARERRLSSSTSFSSVATDRRSASSDCVRANAMMPRIGATTRRSKAPTRSSGSIAGRRLLAASQIG